MPWSYEPYDQLPAEQRAQWINEYRQKFLDFDNDIIVNSAIQVLRANGHDDFQAIQVGPDRRGGAFELTLQLLGKLDLEKHYIFFSLPTLHGRHSVGVVIDNHKKECYVLDSLVTSYHEACQQLQMAIDDGLFPGYSLITPKGNVQQQMDTWSCGIHTSANIVGIINGDINLKTGDGIEPRTDEEVNELLGVFSKAYAEIAIKRGAELENPRLNARQKKAVRSALLETVQPTIQDPNIAADVEEFLARLQAEYPTGAVDEDVLLRQRTFRAFFTEFSAEHPNNALNGIINSEAFYALLPATMQDDVLLKTAAIGAFLVENLPTNLEQDEPPVDSKELPAPDLFEELPVMQPLSLSEEYKRRAATTAPLLVKPSDSHAGQFFQPGQEKSLTATVSPKTTFTGAQIERIRKAVNVLNAEIKSIWPYPNKDRKRDKRDALVFLLSTNKDALEAIAEIKQRPGVCEGAISKRTAKLLHMLEEEIKEANQTGTKKP